MVVPPAWHHRNVLWFWVIVLVAIIGAIAVVAAGRGGSMADVYDDRPDASLPSGRPLTADDLRKLRLNTGVRGYRMDEVDALLDRLQAEMLSRETDEVRDVSPGWSEAGAATVSARRDTSEAGERAASTGGAAPTEEPPAAVEPVPDDGRDQG